MALISFIDWMHQQDESSAFTRLRRDAALGLKPPISPASLHSRSTAHPFEVEELDDKPKKKKKRKKRSKKKKNEWASWLESKKSMPKNQQIDKWLEKVGQLKDDVERNKSKKKEEEEEDKDQKVNQDDNPQDNDKC